MSSARLFALLGAVAALGLGACSSDDNDPSNADAGGAQTPDGQTPGGTKAPAAQVSSCKDSCDKMKFFQCSSAGEQARCYSDCDAAASSQIDLFVGCAQNSICDPDCRTSIQPAPAPGQPAAPPPQGSVASGDSCAAACDKAVQCNFLPVGAKAECAQECATQAYQYQIDCVLNNPCESIRQVCGGIDIEVDTDGDGAAGGGTAGGGGTGGGSTGGDGAAVLACQSGCDKLNFFTCVSPDDHAACRALCGTAEAGKRETFQACAVSGGVDCAQLGGCYTTFAN